MKDKKIGLFGAVSIGVGGMVGGGIFAVLGEAVSFAKGATVIAFLLAGIVALLTSYSYAKFSVKFPSRGGTVVFVDNAFGHNLLSGSLNLVLWISYLVTISLYSISFASYAQTFFPTLKGFYLEHILISLAILVPSFINVVSATFVSRSELVVVIIKVVLLLLIIFTSFTYVDSSRVAIENFSDPFSIFVAGMIIFVAYEGFELIANSSEEIENPEKNLPRAFYISVVLVIVLYLLIAYITVGTVDEKQLLEAKDYALAVAAKPALGDIGFVLVTIAALLATFSAINATVYGNARLGFTLARDGELPKKLNEQRNNIPFAGVVSTALISLVMANSIDITKIAIIASASFLLIFTIINISALKMYKELDANKYLLILSSLVSFTALLTLLYNTYEKNLNALIIFCSFLLFSIVFEFFYGKIARDDKFLESN
ncbi:APC family permease [Arcobacter arenosus]|uniref:Amino acid permease n=1 Tax=Arcobacter arenosus TaxID=2576037 RepID=A0A5R8Y2Q7_9BACT|nr:APC family permease [Arcobacter arenosus]TLP39231.1 amino acid permease [Arcobacter arenosus]